jgi:putative MATE family efflux protein
MASGRANDILEGGITRALVHLAWPVVLSTLLYTSFTIVNAIWIGRLGPEALAAVAPAHFAAWILLAIGELFGIGAAALVARRVGERDLERAGTIAAQGGVLVAIAAAVMLVAGGPAARGLFRLIGTEPSVSRAGASYLALLFQGSLFYLASMYVEAVLRAAGDTRTPMMITGAGLLLNALLDPLLIFGVGPFPRLEVQGAAIATVLSYAFTAILFLLHLRRADAALSIRFRFTSGLDPSVLARIVRIGAPPSFSTALFSIVYLFLTHFLARFGTVPVAAVGVGNRLESVSYLLAHGLSIAAATLVGQNLGAGRQARAKEAAWRATLLSVAVTGTVGAFFFFLPHELVRLFSDDAAVLAEGARFLRILSYCQFLMGVEIAMTGSFAGAGDTVPPTIISSLFSAARIPLAWVVSLPLGYGPVGIWWMITVTCMFRGALLAAWFRRDRWMNRTV